jgi:hypothetical protein
MMARAEMIPCEQREQLRMLLDVRSAADALASYYGLVHDCGRVQLFGYYPNAESLSGFLAVAQTGIDLFRPLVVPFAGTRQGLQRLVETALKPGRHYITYLPVEQQEFLIGCANLSPLQVSNLLRLDSRGFEPIINVLLERHETPDGSMRFEIGSKDGYAAAGINWQTAFSAEIYAEGDSMGYRRGFTKSVLGAVIHQLLQEKLTIFLRVPDDDYRSFEDAFDLGFKPTGVRQVFADLMLKESDPETTSGGAS